MAHDAIFQFPAEVFELISPGGASFTIPVKGQTIVLPTKDVAVLPGQNEFTLNSNRCTIVETPWGGMKRNYPTSFTVGSLYCPTAGVYLQDKNGANTSKYLSAGKLVETSSMSVDTTAKTITEEFIITNTNLNNTESIISDGSSTTGWGNSVGAGGSLTLTSESGRLKVVGQAVDSNGLKIVKSSLNLTGKNFLKFDIECSANKNLYCIVGNTSTGNYKYWRGSRFPITANQNTRFVLPLLAPQGSSGTNPSTVLGTPDLSNCYLYIGTDAADAGQITFYVDNVSSDVGKAAYVEIQTPDNLAENSLNLLCWDGAAYQTTGTYKLDSVYGFVSGTPIAANWKLLDGTQLEHAYGSGQGRSLYPKGSGGSQVTSPAGTLTYSANKGTKYRIGIGVTLPPSDNGRTSFNKIRLKTIISYANSGDSTYEFSNNSLQSTGLKSMTNPWIAMLDSSGNVGYLVFSDRPNSISYVRDDSGDIYELVVDPGNSMVYRGSTYLGNQTADADADAIPDMLEEAVTSSIANALKFHDFNYEQQTQYDLSTSSITANNFSITANSLDIIPFATSQDDIVYTTAGTRLIPAETVATQSGNVSIYDVRNQTAVRVRDTPGIFAGDCKVWDTVTTGNTTESTWTRVYDPDWVFTGDIIIENGLLRLKSAVNAVYTFLQCWTGSSYVDASRCGIVANSTKITQISPDKISYTYLNITTTYNCSLARGAFYISASGSASHVYSTSQCRFVVTNDSIYDAAINPPNPSANVTVDSNTPYAIDIYPTRSTIEFIGGTVGGSTVYVANTGHVTVSNLSAGGARNVGAVPFDCTQLFREAEATADTRLIKNGSVAYTGTDASPGTGNTGWCLQERYSTTGYRFDSTLPSGNYRVYFRCKMVGTAVSADTGIYRKDLGTNEISVITAMINPGSNFAYVSVDYTHNISNNPTQVYLHRNALTSDVNYVVVDYVLIVPVWLIEKHAKRALWNCSPLTTSVVDVPH